MATVAKVGFGCTFLRRGLAKYNKCNSLAFLFEVDVLKTWSETGQDYKKVAWNYRRREEGEWK